MDTKDYDSTKFCTISEGLEISGFENSYFRKLLSEGKIVAEKRMISNTRIERWLVSRSSLEEYLTRGKHSQRTDGRNKYTIYLNPQEYDQLRKLLEKNKMEVPLVRSNPTKTKEVE